MVGKRNICATEYVSYCSGMRLNVGLTNFEVFALFQILIFRKGIFEMHISNFEITY